MIKIEHKITAISSLNGLERDTIVLNWEDRSKARQRVRTTKGMDLALALPTGTILRDGDILYVDSTRYVAVEAAKDGLIVIYPEDFAETALVAYEIGNRHMPVSIKERLILTPCNRHFEDFLNKQKIRYRIKKEVFEPLRKGHLHG